MAATRRESPRNRSRGKPAAPASPPPTPLLLNRVIFGLNLEPARLAASSAPFPRALAQLSARALRLATPADLIERERRLLYLAESVAPVGSERKALSSYQDAYVLMAILAHGWASSKILPRPARNAAFVALVALTACVSFPVRQVQGLLERLVELASRADLDVRVRRLTRSLAEGGNLDEGEVFRTLAVVLDKIEKPRPPTRPTRPTTRRSKRKRARRPRAA